MSVQRLNYATKAIPDLEQLASMLEQNKKAEGSYFVTKLLISLLKKSIKFILPVGGRIWDSEPKQHELDMLKLPYPVIAAEFEFEKTVVNEEDLNEYNRTHCPKTIALAVDLEASGMGQVIVNQGKLREEYKSGVYVHPISYMHFEDLDKYMWIPMVTGIITARGTKIFKPKKDFSDFSKSKGHPVGKTGHLCQPFFWGELGAEAYYKEASKGQHHLNLMVTQDTARETTAIMQLCAALNCSNVKTNSLKPPTGMNFKRGRKKRTPFFEYKVLELVGDNGSSGSRKGHGTHASPRLHFRRGHPRWYKDKEKPIWVTHCMVGNKKDGLVMKDYAV
tara:strand:- start:459 stop:1460 length:1002 start_codon:yes stop_codon:yes gene_type:complete